MIREIRSEEKVVALYISTDDIVDGTHPITDPSNSLQMLMMKRGKGHIFAKHTHRLMERSTSILQEAVVVTRGALKITICTREGVDVETVTVKEGECLYLVDGGYALEVTEDVVFFEFKNGPHTEDKILL